jgi:hypothetical protein
MNRFTIILCTALLLLPAGARAEWTAADTHWQTAYLALHIVDWGQSRYIASHPELEEYNAILGRSPSVAAVDRYFAAAAIAHTAISYALPAEYRRWWQCLTIGLEMGITANNYRAGIQLKF